MIENQAEKLSRFASSVNLEVNEKIQLIEKQALDEKYELLEKTENKALEEAYVKIQKAVRETEGKYRRNIALKEQKLRTDVLKHRDELSQKIFKSVEEKIIDFTNSDKYSIFLRKQLENEDLKEAVVKLSEKDMKKYSQIIADISKNPPEIDNDIQLGGVLIVYNDRGIIIDKTIDSFFEERKNSFSSEYKFDVNQS